MGLNRSLFSNFSDFSKPTPKNFPMQKANFIADVHGGRSGTIPPSWDNVPNFRTREDLLAARRRAARPDITFDLDGDGFVSSSFVGEREREGGRAVSLFFKKIHLKAEELS